MTNPPKSPLNRRQPRRDQVRAVLEDVGEHGVTWRELGARLGWDHGSASGALSVLHDSGEAVRLRTTRERCGVYVRPEYATPEQIATRRQSSSPNVEVARQDGYAEGWRAGYDEARILSAEKASEMRREGAQRLQAELLRIAAAMTRSVDPHGVSAVHSSSCWRTHPACAVRAMSRAIAEPKHIETASRVSIKWYNETGERTKEVS